MGQMIQGSDEWKAARLGKITGSRFADVLAGKRGKFSKAADDYMMELIGEILTGVSSDEINSRATNWGNMHEPNARMWYICESGETLEETGVIHHPEIEGVACSPDALVGDEGILEIKCPYSTRVHLRTLESRRVPAEYEPQVHGNLWVTGRQWCDFVSYDPRFKDSSLCQVRIRVERDELYIEEIAESVVRFREQLEIRLAKILKIGEQS